MLAVTSAPCDSQPTQTELPGWALALIITLGVLAFLAWACNLRAHVLQQAQTPSAAPAGIEQKVTL